ncbi:MAG: hypothetical protein R3C42_07980 [Parvularculaceae bacterium]
MMKTGRQAQRGNAAGWLLIIILIIAIVAGIYYRRGGAPAAGDAPISDAASADDAGAWKTRLATTRPLTT